MLNSKLRDESQKRFDGLHNEACNTGRKWLECASNFIQNLSGIANGNPNILILVISVLNNNTEAFRQIHRNDPVVIDFHGPQPRKIDRSWYCIVYFAVNIR